MFEHPATTKEERNREGERVREIGRCGERERKTIATYTIRTCKYEHTTEYIQ